MISAVSEVYVDFMRININNVGRLLRRNKAGRKLRKGLHAASSLARRRKDRSSCYVALSSLPCVAGFAEQARRVA
jgi:predicted phosphoribosyltransferase